MYAQKCKKNEGLKTTVDLDTGTLLKPGPIT